MQITQLITSLTLCIRRIFEIADFVAYDNDKKTETALLQYCKSVKYDNDFVSAFLCGICSSRCKLMMISEKLLGTVMS